MKGKFHILINIIFFTVFWLAFEKITLSMLLVSVMGAYAPDADRNFKSLGHRSFWTHNSLLWLLLYVFNPNEFLLIISMALGLHCLLDVRVNKQVGFYTIKVLRRKNVKTGDWYSLVRMNGKQTTVWLFANFTVSLIVLMTWCLV